MDECKPLAVGGGSGGGPGARQGLTLTADGAGNLLLFGGERSGYLYGDVWRLDPASASWTFLAAVGAASPPPGRGLHSFTSKLNLSTFYWIGGTRRGWVAHVKGVLGGV